MSKKVMNEGHYADLALIFYLSKKFITKFEKWAAFELGIIDKKGKILKKRLVTKEERNAFTPLDKFILKIRTLIGDNLFVKLGSVALLLMDDKMDGNMLVEDYANDDERLFATIKENFLDSSISITVPLSSRKEEIRFEYEDNDDESFSLIIGVFLDGEMVSNLGGSFLPSNTTNGIFLQDLDSILSSNLDVGGHQELTMTDSDGQEITLDVSYNTNEIRVINTTPDVITAINTDFYIIFKDNAEREKFLEGWEKFIEQIL